MAIGQADRHNFLFLYSTRVSTESKKIEWKSGEPCIMECQSFRPDSFNEFDPAKRGVFPQILIQKLDRLGAVFPVYSLPLLPL